MGTVWGEGVVCVGTEVSGVTADEWGMQCGLTGRGLWG